MQKLKNFLSNKVGLVFIILIGLLPLTWFRDGLLIAGGDEYGLLDPGALTEYFKYAWNIKLVNEGGVIFSIPKLIPMLYFWTIFESLGLSLLVIEKLWFIFLFLGPGLSMYYLMSQIYNRNWAKVVSSVLYMFNLFVVVAVPFNSNMKPVLIALPLMLTFWIKGLNSEGKGCLKYAILTALCSLIYAGSNVNLPSVAPVPIVLSLYLIAFTLYKRNDYLKILRFILATIVCYITINFWWIGVFLLTFINEASSSRSVLSFGAIDSGSNLLDFFRLLGSWGWKGGHYKMFYYPYANFYDAPFLLILSFLIPVLSFLAVVLRPKDKKILFFSLLALVGIFLSKGVASPFGFIYKWMFENIPFFWTFREPFAKFTPITLFSYSILVGFTTDIIYQKIKNLQIFKNLRLELLPHLFPVVVITIIFFVSFPLFSGEAIWNYWNGSMRSLHIKIPEYWYEVGDWLRQKNIYSKVFLTPKGGYGLAYNWEQGFSTAETPAVILIDNPTVRVLPEISPSDKVVNKVFGQIDPDKNNQLLTFLTLLNIKYILQQNDLDWRFAFKDTYSPVQMKSLLQKQEGISFLRSFGKLDLYKINDSDYLPTVYVPKKSIYSNGTIEDLPKILNLENENVRQEIFLENSKIDDKPEAISNIDEFFLIGELKGGIKEEDIGEPISKITLPVTYAKNKPGSFLYGLALKREQIDKSKVKGNSEKLFEKLLFYASKRVDEILLYKEFSNNLIEDYEKKMIEAVGILEKLKIDKPKSYYHLFIKLKGYLQAHQLKLESLGLGETERLKVDMAFKGLNEKMGETREIRDFFNLEYTFNIIKEGEYEVFVNNGGKIIRIGQRNLEKGIQKVTLPDNQLSENLIEPNLKVRDYSPDSLYRISINYKSEGKRGGVSLSEGKQGRLFDVSLPRTDTYDKDYKKFEMFFKSSPRADRAIVNLSVEEFNEFNIEKITQPKLILRSKFFEEKKVPSITLRRVNPTKFVVRVQGATLPYFLVLNESFNKNWKLYLKETSENEFGDSQDNISYFDGEIVEQKAKMTFLDWNIFETWGLKPIANDKHLLVNGYANSWFISPNDVGNRKDYEIVIEFGPQRVFYTGIGVSALTLFGFFSFLTIKFLKGKLTRQ